MKTARSILLIIMLINTRVFAQSVSVISKLEIIDIKSGERKTVYEEKGHFEAPNWTPDGKFLIFNSKGYIYKIPINGGTPEQIPTGFANRCNNDHVLSSNGKQLAISHNTSDKGSLIYILPIEGGEPRLVTQNGPSYLHGWSPDGNTLTYCAERNGNYDVYTIPVAGGSETRLTTAEGLDDGPEYSPDGKFIYFNSIRSGKMQLYRMKNDGSQQEQLTFDKYNNWFPHVSPNNKQIIFLSYESDVDGHPANKDVLLRMMPTKGGTMKTVVKLFGGQGTINVNSWSPDSKKVAFVSYEIME